jgi:DNA-directed RNA polymerase specialized sigma24 family protein
VMVEAEEAQIVRRAVEALPQGARRALLLYRFQGHSQGEIAAMMGISLSGVEKHLALAMRHLRTRLNDCGFFEVEASGKQETVGAAATDRNSMP